MDFEMINVKIKEDEKIREIEFKLLDEAEDDIDQVQITVGFNSTEIIFKADNYFEALKQVRVFFENKNIQVCCNGAGRSVYPSGMQLSMGVGRSAYNLKYGKQAMLVDVVDIFEYENDLNFVSIKEQENAFEEWLQSLGL